MALNSNFRTLTANNIEGIVDERNYLSSSFENGTLTGWTEMSVALTSGLPTGTPTISSTAASSLALSTTTSTPLSGSRSMLMTVASALTAGHGFISQEFTLDRMDLGKVLTVSFDYERISGTYNFSGTLGSQTLMVYIYDATAGGANWIQPAGFLGMNQSSNPGRVACTFQSSVTAGQKYRVAVIASQAASGASSIEFDNFTCSRQTAPIGPVVTDWVSYTPTFTLGSGSLTNYSANARWRRVGDSIEVMGKIIFSAASAGFSQIYASMPTGINIDSTKLTSGLQSVIGQCAALDFGIANYTGGSVFYQSANLVYLAPSAINSHVGTAPVFTPGFSNTFPITFNTNDEISWHFMAPIAGWSSNVQLSNDTDTRVVSCKVGTTGNQAIATATWSKCTSLSSSALIDTHSAYDSTNKRIIFPVSGIYTILCSAVFAANGSGGRAVGYTINGAAIPSEGGAGQGGVASDQLASTYQSTVSVRAGDYVELAVYQSSGGNLNLIGGTLQAFRLSGPSVVAASETVACRYTNNAGTSIGTSPTLVPYNLKDYDLTNSYSSGVFTVPVSGKYAVNAKFLNAVLSLPNTGYFNIHIYKNGSSASFAQVVPSGGAATSYTMQVSDVISCNAGDTIAIYGNVSTGTMTLNPTATFNTLSIVRVGN